MKVVECMDCESYEIRKYGLRRHKSYRCTRLGKRLDRIKVCPLRNLEEASG